jgi:hypothetical protein
LLLIEAMALVAPRATVGGKSPGKPDSNANASWSPSAWLSRSV